MLPGQPAVISNSAWSRIRSDSKSRIRSSRGNSLHSSRGKNPPKSHQTETCRHESRSRENLPARNRPRENSRRESRHRNRPSCALAVPAATTGAKAITMMAAVLTTCGSCDPPFHIPHPIHYRIPGMYEGRRTGPPRQKEISGLLEYVAVAAGLESDWAVAGDAVGDDHPNKSIKPKLGFAHRIHRGAGWNKRRRAPVSVGMARQVRRPASNGDPLQRVYRPALTLAST
jgi:hypothetical protein